LIRLFKFGLSRTWKAFKVLPHNCFFHVHTQLEPMTFCMETLIALRKRLEILVEKSSDLWSNSHWAIYWYEKPSKYYQGCP